VKRFFPAAILVACFTGCAGYHIGSVKPYYLRDIHTIAVPTFKNNTLVPRIEVLITDTVIKQFQQDGTYRIVGDDEADAILKAEIVGISRTQARSVIGNVLATQEFNLTLRVRYSLINRADETVLAPPATVSGTTSFFVSSDIVTDERQALPLATEDVATHLVSALSEGW
jgi:outer membrane lipopolysaccharide assembly protein LptE/RlpB